MKVLDAYSFKSEPVSDRVTLSFSNAFETLTGHKPLPWQSRLFSEYLAYGKLPSAVSIPTGLGKTAVMAIWLIALAVQDETHGRHGLARRLVYVVDRRAVVDQSTSFAEGLRARLALPQADALRHALGLADGQKLPISTLRGQFVDNREWLEDPSLPAIVIGTVDMVGSRLLFEGYGVSRKMRPYHAGLLGADTLVLLDEAHLVPPFEALLATIANEPHVYGACNEENRQIIPPFKLLPLSATNRNAGTAKFALKEQDYSDPNDVGADLTRKRLDAIKLLSIEPAGEKLPEAIVSKAWEISGEGMNNYRYLIYCDKRDDAQKVYADLSGRITKQLKSQIRKEKGESAKSYDDRLAAAAAAEGERIELFVGARRVYERVEAARRLETMGFLADAARQEGLARFLVATSAGEVGVDLDADHLVCDLVAWERMVQRFGRVNRRGDNDSSNIFVLAAPPKAPKTDEPQKPEIVVLSEPQKPIKPRKPGKKASPEEHTAYTEALSRYDQEKKRYDNELNAFKKQQKEFKTAAERYRKDLAQYQKEWAETLLYKARISLLGRLNGNASPRALLDLSTDPDLLPEIQACCTPPPLRPALSRPLVDAWTMTSLDVHTGRPGVEPWLRGWVDDDQPQTTIVWREHLPARDKLPVTKKEIERFFEAAPVQTVERLETETRRVLEWLMRRVEQALVRCDRPALDVLGEEVELETSAFSLKPEDTIGVLLAKDGTCKRTLFARELLPRQLPDEKAKAKFQAELYGATLVLSAGLGGIENGLLNEEANSCAPAADGGLWGESEDGKPLIPFRIRLLDAEDSPQEGNWREAQRFGLERNSEDEVTRWLIVDEWPDSSNIEDRRSSGPAQSLVEHQSCAEKCAQRIGMRLGLKDLYLEVLVIAARLHDEGKQVDRWQDAFRADRDGRPYAKTRGPINFTLLDGYRHEFGSLPYAQKDEAFQKLPKDLQDLVLHLVAAHHGFARPVISTNGCEDAPPSALEARARDVALRFARLQRRWGPWGLAWWEALLRAADQQASRKNDIRDPNLQKEADQ